MVATGAVGYGPETQKPRNRCVAPSATDYDNTKVQRTESYGFTAVLLLSAGNLIRAPACGGSNNRTSSVNLLPPFSCAKRSSLAQRVYVFSRMLDEDTTFLVFANSAN